MGETAENVARQWRISREEQDRMALWSQQKWAAAQEMGLFDDEILPVSVPAARGASTLVSVDEHPRPDTTLDKLARLRPAFAKDDLGTVTAGNSSGVNDGAAALLLVEESRAASLGLTPMAFIGPSAAAGVDPAHMGIGPVPASRRALGRAGWKVDDLDVIELNEAFAAQVIACVRELDVDQARLNPKGGAIAIGHPLGCSGARMAASLVHELRRRGARRGLATACIGVGQGLATVIEGA